MKITLRTVAGEAHDFLLNESDDPPSSPIPCFRCGVCCERWQPLIDANTAKRIADALGRSELAFIEEYTQPYPLHDERWLIRRGESGACTFLDYDNKGLAGCRVHTVRPDACRDWEAGLEKRECHEGLQQLSHPASVLLPSELYPETDARWQFVNAVSRRA